MVEEVKEISPVFQLEPFVDCERLRRGGVEANQTRSIVGVPARSAEPARGCTTAAVFVGCGTGAERVGIGLSEERRIEEVVGIPTVDHERACALNVRPVGKAVEPAKIDSRVGEDCERIAGSEVGYPGERPTAQDLLHESMCAAEESFALAHRQIQNKGVDE